MARVGLFLYFMVFGADIRNKKSIFAFWKFAKKDESNLLVQGEEKEQGNNGLRKIFDYFMDGEEIGEKADKVSDKSKTFAIDFFIFDFLSCLNLG